MQVEIDKLKWEVKRQQDIGLILAEKLNEKIDECEALKADLWRFEAALDRILSNCSSNCSDEDLVIDITSEALYGDR